MLYALLATLLFTATIGESPAPSPNGWRHHAPQQVPDFKKDPWTSFRVAQTFVHQKMPWGIASFYIRQDRKAMGMELALAWDAHNAVYKIWSEGDNISYQSLLTPSGWTTPVRGDKMNFTVHPDAERTQIVGVVLQLYQKTPEQVVASETFSRPSGP